MNMELYSVLSTIITLFLGGGWFIYYRANKKKAYAEATEAEANGWKAQQDVYKRTIEDLEGSCNFIRQDRDELRQENAQLKVENRQLRDKIHELEGIIADIRSELARQGRRIEAVVQEQKINKTK